MADIETLWLTIGLLAQVAFSARFGLQWLLSERARRSLLPVHFWTFSVIGSVLLLAYACHRRDPVIASGQLLGLGIYLRNIQLLSRASGRAIPAFGAWLLLAAAASSIGLLSHAVPLNAITASSEPTWMLLGFVGQALFTGRFVVQLVYSEKAQASVNPVIFWYLSMSGSLLLLGYALHTGDIVIILGQSFGLLVYLRNLHLFRQHREAEADQHGEEPPVSETGPNEILLDERSSPTAGPGRS